MRKFIPIILCLLLAACNMPTQNSDDLNNQAGTIVTLTLSTNNTPTRENTPLATSSPEATGTPIPTMTPTYSVPILTFSEPTNCRLGPGQSFDILFTFISGSSAEIVGRYPVNNYWVVQGQGSFEPCWVWGEYGSPSGSYWVVPSVTPPATAAPQVVKQPTHLIYNYGCSFNGVNSDVSVTLTWTDKADNELGYRVYRDDVQIIELPPNSTTYSDNLTTDSSQVISYGVAAYNAVGESNRPKISFSCQ